MGHRFNQASHADQQAVCQGCPVAEQCLDDVIERARRFGQREILDGDLVCGGLKPWDILKELRRRNGVQAQANSVG